MRSLSHVEIYIPNIPLPEGFSEPPPRDAFLETLSWHFHDEPHPLGWYMAMWAWTEVFGTSHLALRLPSALIGTAAIPAIWLLARQIWDRNTAHVAAAMTCLHGFLVFWSQNARMYTAGMLFVILSTYFLLRLIDTDRRSPWLEFGYVATCLAGIQSVELFWPVLMMQVLWVVLMSDSVKYRGLVQSILHPAEAAPRLFQVQSMILMLSTPSLAHSAYQARNNAAESPSLELLFDYFGFGFLLARLDFAVPQLVLPFPVLMALALAGILFVWFGLRSEPRPVGKAAGGTSPLPAWLIGGVLVLSVGLMVYIGLIAYRRRIFLLALTVLVVLAFALPTFAAVFRHVLGRIIPPYEAWRQRVSASSVLLVLCGIVAPLLLFAASAILTLIAPRAWTVFVPFLLLMIAAGILRVYERSRTIGRGVAAAMLAMFVVSLFWNARNPGSPNDYQSLARVMKPAMQEGDLVLVGDRAWADAPFFYYLRDANYVPRDWVETINADPEARVWVISWPDVGESADDYSGLVEEAGYVEIERFEAFRAAAQLFVRAGEG